MRKRCTLTALVIALAIATAVPAVAAGGDTIYRGVDVFTTTANGKTFYDFAANPIPAGFFCEGSPAFTGRVALRGEPLTTEVPGQLRGSDTVIERLDDAVFNADGYAETRIRFRALSMVSVEPIRTPCGAFDLHVGLAGPQRVTTMRIYRTAKQGGSFHAPLAANTRLTFSPVEGRSDRKLEIGWQVTFPAASIPWSDPAGTLAKRIGPAVVDTDGDKVPDTPVRGTSNFAAGWPPGGIANVGGCRVCEPETCHDNSGETHCSGPIVACAPAACP